MQPKRASTDIRSRAEHLEVGTGITGEAQKGARLKRKHMRAQAVPPVLPQHAHELHRLPEGVCDRSEGLSVRVRVLLLRAPLLAGGFLRGRAAAAAGLPGSFPGAAGRLLARRGRLRLALPRRLLLLLPLLLLRV